MPQVIQPWQQIDSNELERLKRAQKSKTWADEQRAKVAKMWADQQRKRMRDLMTKHGFVQPQTGGVPITPGNVPATTSSGVPRGPRDTPRSDAGISGDNSLFGAANAAVNKPLFGLLDNVDVGGAINQARNNPIGRAAETALRAPGEFGLLTGRVGGEVANYGAQVGAAGMSDVITNPGTVRPEDMLGPGGTVLGRGVRRIADAVAPGTGNDPIERTLSFINNLRETGASAGDPYHAAVTNVAGPVSDIVGQTTADYSRASYASTKKGGDEAAATSAGAVAKTLAYLGTTLAGESAVDPTMMIGGGHAATKAPALIEKAGAAAERAPGVLERVGGAAKRLATEEEGSLRLYHGTGEAFDTPDPAKFKADGLYGPGYYLTTSTDIAGGLVDDAGNVKGLGYAHKGYSEAPPIAHMTWDDSVQVLREVASQKGLVSDSKSYLEQLAKYASGPNAYTSPWYLFEKIQRLLPKSTWKRVEAAIEARMADRPRSAPNVRAVDVPEDLKLFDTEAPISAEEQRRIFELGVSGYKVPQGEHFQYETTGNGFYSTLEGYLDSKTDINKTLAAAGYDGITYPGGRMTPMRNAAGSPIEHNATVVFPESMPKLKNSLSGTAMGASAGFGIDDEGNPTFSPERAALGMAAGTLAGHSAVRKALKPATKRIVDTLERLTPERVPQIEQRTLARLADTFDLAHQPHLIDLFRRTFDAADRLLQKTKVVATAVDKYKLDDLLTGGRIRGKREIAAGDPDKLARIIQQNIGKKPNGEWRVTLEQAAQFGEDEARATMAVFGDMPDHSYAHVTEGPPLIGETTPLVYTVWDDGTPRASTLLHHFGLVNPESPLHTGMPVAFQRELWQGVDPHAPRVDIGDGKQVLDTPWVVGPAGENRMLTANRLLSMPPEVVERIKSGLIKDPDELAAAILRGKKRQHQPLVESVKALGLGEGVGDQYKLASAVNHNRSESLILEPTVENIKAIYIVGAPERLRKVPTKAPKGTPTNIEAAERLQASIKERTGRTVPIVMHELTPGGSKTMPAELAPGRQAVVDAYKKLGLTDIGAGGAGGLAGIGVDDEGNPTFDPERAALGMAAGSLLGNKKVRGVARKFAHPALAKVDGLFEQAARPSIGKSLADAKDAHIRNFVNAWTDRGVDLKQWQQKIERDIGRPLQPNEMAAELVRLNADKAAEVHIQERLKPALDLVGADEPQLAIYLAMQDNVDVARAMGIKAGRAAIGNAVPTSPAEVRRLAAGYRAAADRVSSTRKFSGDLTLAESEAVLAALPTELGPERMAKIEQAADHVWAFGRSLLYRKRQAGGITQELFDDLTKKYPHYSPTRILDYMKEPGNVGRGRSLSVRDRGLRANTLEGTARARENPLASMIRYAYETEAFARKNDAFNAFVRLRDLSPEMKTLIRETSSSYTPTRAEKAVEGWVDGVKKSYVLPVDLASVVQMEATGAAPKFLTTAMGVYRALLTSRNPAFLAANSLNDAFTYAIRTASIEGGPHKIPAVTLDLAKAYGDAFKGLLSGTYHGDTARFLKSGGGQSGYFQGTEGGARTALADVRRGGGIVVENHGDLVRLVRDLVTLKPVEAIGERIELAPRVAAYRRAEKTGKNAVEATIAGRKVTIDFAEGGHFAKQINQFVPFFNVAFQAGAVPFRTFKENPKGFISTAATLLVAPIVAAEAWNRSDPERAKDYADVPQYIKDQGVVIMLPVAAPTDETGERRPQFIVLRTREYAAISTLARSIAERVIGTDDPRAWRDVAGATAQALSPLQFTGGADLFSSLTPPFVSTGLQLTADKDFFRGGAIATKRNDEKASALAGAVGGATGLRPSQAEFAIRDVGGGVAQMAGAASNAVAGRPTGNAPQDIPVAGQMIGRFVRGDTGETLHQAADEAIGDINSQPEFKRLGITFSGIDDTFRDIPLTREERAAAYEATSADALATIDAYTSDPSWAEIGDEDKARLIRRILSEARERALLDVLGKITNDDPRLTGGG